MSAVSNHQQETIDKVTLFNIALRTATHFKVITLRCQDDLVSPDLALVAGDERDIVQEAVLLVIDAPEIVHELDRVLLRDT